MHFILYYMYNCTGTSLKVWVNLYREPVLPPHYRLKNTRWDGVKRQVLSTIIPASIGYPMDVQWMLGCYVHWMLGFMLAWQCCKSGCQSSKSGNCQVHLATVQIFMATGKFAGNCIFSTFDRKHATKCTILILFLQKFPGGGPPDPP